MLKELINFTNQLDTDFTQLGLTPKDGLHLVLSVKTTDKGIQIGTTLESVYASKKTSTSSLLEKCAAWSQVAWMVNTNKCLDLPTKAIHSASPYCFAVKRENLEGGEKYNTNAKNGKSQVYERVAAYFDKAIELIESEEDIAIAEAFKSVLSDRQQLHQWLESVEKFAELKDKEYVIFYLDLPIAQYQKANDTYLKEKLFNTSDYNIEDAKNENLLHGTSNWLNGFPTKKPFLLHQSATFDIAGRITSKEAKTLYDFAELSRRKLFPNPLPIFIMQKELSQKAIKLYKDDYEKGATAKKNYLKIIRELHEERTEDLGNYYLLFTVAGEIKDFDYVSKFEFNLAPGGSPWKVVDLFGIEQDLSISTVTDFQNRIMPILFNNALVVRKKEGSWRFRYFDDIDAQYCKTYNTYLLVMKYRKAFYDFIYKSKRQGVTAKAIKEILTTSILDDIRLDEYKNNQHSESYNIRSKLNLLFSLYQYFSNATKSIFMPNKITELREFIDSTAADESNKVLIENDEQFAFAAGQVIARIFYESQTEDQSYRYLEPFLNQTNATGLKRAIANFFKRYKHGVYAHRFSRVFSQTMTYDLAGNLKELLPILLAGVFSKNQLFSDKTQAELAEKAA